MREYVCKVVDSNKPGLATTICAESDVAAAIKFYTRHCVYDSIVDVSGVKFAYRGHSFVRLTEEVCNEQS